MSATTPQPARTSFARAAVGVAVGAAVADIALIAAGLPAFPCPASGLGASCPGCGLGRAVVAMLRGDFESMLRLHAFAPLAVVGILLAGLLLALPRERRRRVAGALSALESGTRIGLILGVALVLYWLARLVFGGAVHGAGAAG